MAAARPLLITLEIPARRMNLFFDARMQSPPDLRKRKEAPRRINASVSKQVLLTACENGTVSQFPSQRNRRRSSQLPRLVTNFNSRSVHGRAAAYTAFRAQFPMD